VSFAAMPAALLGALAALTAAVVLALYFLRPTPRVQPVSNVAFWLRAVQRARPKLLFSRQLPWLALLFTMLIALALVASMGDPRLGSGERGTTVVVLDADRTMAARDGARSRLDEALARLRELAQRETIAGQVAVVRAGIHARVLTGVTSRPSDVDRAVAGIQTDDGMADLRAAVVLAEAVLRRAGGNGRIVVLADRLSERDIPETVRVASRAQSAEENPGAARWTPPEATATTSPAVTPVAPRLPLVFVPVGRRGETVAITAFGARRDPLALGEYGVHCEVHAYTEHPAHARLVVRDRQVVISQEELTIEPGATVMHHAQGFSSEQGELSARLEDVRIEGGARDALASDDVAFAAVEPLRPARVLLVSAGNVPLERVLAANPAVQLARMAPAELSARRGELERYDIVVLDRVAPAAGVAHPALLLFAPPDAPPVRSGRALSNPRVTAYASDHRVLAGVRFDQVWIGQARALSAAQDDRVLVRSGPDALVVARDRAGARTLALGFGTDQTDLVRRVAFPLMMHNALIWLGRREAAYQSYQRPGELVRAPLARGVVLMPDGSAQEARGGMLYETSRAGIYHAGERALGVSAVDLAGALPAGAQTTASAAPPGRRIPPLGVILAAALLGLIALEWFLLHRGWLP
jgi:hypothetical protein